MRPEINTRSAPKRSTTLACAFLASALFSTAALRAMETEVDQFPVLSPDMYSETVRRALKNSPPTVVVKGIWFQTPINKVKISRVEAGCDGTLCPTIVEYTLDEKTFSFVIFCQEYWRGYSTPITLLSGEITHAIYFKVKTGVQGVTLSSFGPILSSIE